MPYLANYDPEKRSFLINGFTHGFRVPSSMVSNLPLTYHNHPSALQNSSAVDLKLSKELEKGRIAGPFNDPPFLDFVVSPLMLVPKRDSADFRIIHDLSYPKDNSVNSNIDPLLASVCYELLDDCMAKILPLGPGALMAKADLQDAFRIIPIHPDDYRLLGFVWNGSYYYDRCLPMGCRVSCAIFEALSAALQWILQHHLGILHMSHILDDFIFFGPPDSPICNRGLQAFFCLAASLGLPIKHSKTVLPATCVILHGIEVDTVAGELRLPFDKLEQARTLVRAMSCRKKTRLRALQSLLGTLNFACRAVVPGRAFLRRLFDLTAGLSSLHLRLSCEARADLAAWKLFLDHFNGSMFFLPASFSSSSALELFTDASGFAFAGICGSHWFNGVFPTSWSSKNIVIKELLPIVLSLKLWGNSLANRKIIFFTDNEALVSIINKQTTPQKDIMALVRSLVVCSLQFNILFRAKHIPGKLNITADLLSRCQVEKAMSGAPWLDSSPHQLDPTWLPW